MKVKLDENLPLRLATLLKPLGHDVHTVHDERLVGRADGEIVEETWSHASADYFKRKTSASGPTALLSPQNARFAS